MEFRLSFLANGLQLYDDEIHFLVIQGAIAQALQVADDGRAQTLAEGLGSTPRRHTAKLTIAGNPQNTAAKIGATILFYWLGPRYSYLWAVTPNRTGWFRYHLPR